jgi:N-acetylglutamate synthase-like GNAT family acetyltransferase
VAEGLISGTNGASNGRASHTLFGAGQLSIRLARLDEAEAIVDLTLAAFRGREHFSRTALASKSDVETLMTQGKFLLAENDRGIIGYAYLEPRMEASRLELLAVTPAQQRSGIGSQLLEAAERMSRGMRCLFMHIRVMNLNWETLTFCRRRGYVEFALEPLHTQQALSPHCHLVRMCKQLDTARAEF